MTAMRLADVVVAATGSRNPAKQLDEEFIYVDVTAIDNEAKRIIGAKRMKGAEAPSRARKVLCAGDVLVSTVRPNLNAVALVPEVLDDQIASTGFCVLRAKTEIVLPEYLFYFVQSTRFVGELTKLVSGALYPAVTDRQVLDQRIPVPSVDEQRRIVDLLSRAEDILRLRRAAQAKAQAIIPALFVDMFGDPATNPKGWPVRPLGSLADVQGGLQVTRTRKTLPIERPYLRVANVYRDNLDLTEVKTIRMTEAEWLRTALRPGDLLVVEGHGNPHEVGRVAVWGGQIPDCTHQNHLIRARSDPTHLLPSYACALLNSASGRQALVRSGKTTSGLSTISARNVKETPVMLPPLEVQERFDERGRTIQSIVAQQAVATKKAETIFQSFLAREFSNCVDKN